MKNPPVSTAAPLGAASGRRISRAAPPVLRWRARGVQNRARPVAAGRVCSLR
ncbi:hypothetical protein [Desulfovirgula thermocuniculi]|uniref:hypothetical protein n=1 Tax=Desulfovirgula thermocuniculi TaxID=348842 RepID=UPI0012EB2E19|nr:hypothetical protein [Desulfovirgula thermocuniculi]